MGSSLIVSCSVLVINITLHSLNINVTTKFINWKKIIITIGRTPLIIFIFKKLYLDKGSRKERKIEWKWWGKGKKEKRENKKIKFSRKIFNIFYYILSYFTFFTINKKIWSSFYCNAIIIS